MVLVAPNAVPTEILDTISAAMEKAMKSESFVESLRRLSLEPSYLGPEGTKIFVKSESERNGINIKQMMTNKTE